MDLSRWVGIVSISATAVIAAASAK